MGRVFLMETATPGIPRADCRLDRTKVQAPDLKVSYTK